MAKKLTIKGITFPNFIIDKDSIDDSKKNFRLIFYIGYTDNEGNEKATIVTKPDSGQWQWRKKSSKYPYLPPTDIEGNSVKLDTGILRTGDGDKIPLGSHKIAEIDGEITHITVQFMDVHNPSIKSFLESKVLPQVIDHLQSLGINPIDLIPVPTAFTTIIKDNVKIDDLATKFKTFLTKEKKDKLLHSISQEYNGENPLVLEEKDVKWGKKINNKGTYGVTIGVD